MFRQEHVQLYILYTCTCILCVTQRYRLFSIIKHDIVNTIDKLKITALIILSIL